LRGRLADPITDDDDSTPAGAAKKRLRQIPFVGDSLADTLGGNELFIKAFNGIDALIDSFKGLVLSFVNGRQNEAKKAITKQLDASDGSFNNVANALGMGSDPKLAGDLKTICKNATSEAFGWMGMDTDPNTAAELTLNLQKKLEARIRKGLVEKYGRTLDDSEREDIAEKAAAAITGINRDDLKSADGKALIATSPPTQGYGAMIFSVSQATKGSAITVPDFTLEMTNLEAAQAAANSPQPPAAPGTPPATNLNRAQKQAKIWWEDAIKKRNGGAFDATFDTDNDGKLSLEEANAGLVKALNKPNGALEEADFAKVAADFFNLLGPKQGGRTVKAG